jgi:undecaprenyl diphosphate synthase
MIFLAKDEMSVNTLEETTSIYTGEELSFIDRAKMPKHVAIMMDGNRRWAQERGLPSTMGHWEGAETLTEIIRAASELGIKTVTVYAFSTENWSRPADEVLDVMNIFELYLMRKKEFMIKEGVRLDAIGNLSRLPAKVQKAFHETKEATQHCDRINLVLALNYGARDEIRRAIAKIVEEKLSVDQITEECIAAHLDTSRFGDPQLLIRTSGEMRLSNFLLWQISYAEIISTPVLWPSFSSKDLYEALLVYQKRQKRLGG